MISKITNFLFSCVSVWQIWFFCLLLNYYFTLSSHDLQTHNTNRHVAVWHWEILRAFSHTDPTSTFFPREAVRGRALVHITLGQKASSSQHHRRRVQCYIMRGLRDSPKLEFRRATRWFMSKVKKSQSYYAYTHGVVVWR